MVQFLLTTLLLGVVPVEQDYLAAMAKAKEQQKLLVVACGCEGYFQTLHRQWQDYCVFCQVPATATLSLQGQDVPLMKHPSLVGMYGTDGPGVFVVNYRYKSYPGCVISVLPCRHVTPQKVLHLLWLPEGSLTQRTLIWALRTHPEAPRSVWRRPSWHLFNHTERHSFQQARSRAQYHANITASGVKQEIIAESWPESFNVVDAAVDIIASWRQSGGHWGACCNGGPCYGYDMKRVYGKWYATGAFSD